MAEWVAEKEVALEEGAMEVVAMEEEARVEEARAAVASVEEAPVEEPTVLGWVEVPAGVALAAEELVVAGAAVGWEAVE